MENKTKTVGVIILVINIFLLIVSFFANVYDTADDKEINNINENSVLILTIIFFITMTLSFGFVIINKLTKNRVLIFLMLIIGIFSLVEFIRMLGFYEG